MVQTIQTLILFIFLIFFLNTIGKSQHVTLNAGDTDSTKVTFYDIVPDTTIICAYPNQQQMLLDLNHDGTDDIKVIGYRFQNGAGLIEQGVYLNILQGEILKDTTVSNQVNVLSLNDTIQNNNHWQNTSQYYVSYYYYLPAAPPGHPTTIARYGNVSNKYFAYRMYNATDTVYYWIKFSTSNYSLILKEYASIPKGVIITSVIKDSVKDLFIAPNPNNGIFNLYSDNEKSDVIISITDMIGRKIFKSEIRKNIEINLSQQPKGLYFLEIVSDKHSEIRKLIIQ